MKKIVLILLCTVFTLSSAAQQNHPQRFSPEKFQQELEQYVVSEAKLTPQESAKFLPIFAEMHQKQRAVYKKQRDLWKANLSDESVCRNVVKQNDELDIELKKLQQQYHEKFLNVIPASKVLSVIHAENRFHREQLKKWGRHKR
ncbi:MAG: hypothetical protein IJ527_03040 [Prevotella sp.]|nr:hypothetical protein [Prevotella sp.]